MFYLLKTSQSGGHGVADIRLAAEKVKSVGGCLVLTDILTFRSVPKFLKICRDVGVEHLVGMDINLAIDKKMVGKVTLMAYNDSGIESLSRILSTTNLDPYNISNTKFTDSESSLGGLNTNKITELNVIIKNKRGLYALCTDNSPVALDGEEEKKEAFEKISDAFDKGLFGGTLSLGGESYEFDRKMFEATNGRVVSTANIHMNGDDDDLLIATSHARGLKSKTVFKLSDRFEYGHKHFNDAVKKNTNGLIRNLKKWKSDGNVYGTILKQEAVPALGLEVTFKQDVRDKLESYLKENPDVKGKESVYASTLQKELDLIEKMGFEEYFEIVISALKFYKDNGVSCRIRGSAASSLVLFLMGDHHDLVDPLIAGNNILRFLAERNSKLPDIDIDVSNRHRLKFYNYVQNQLLGGGKASQYRVASLISESRIGKLRQSIEFAYTGYSAFINNVDKEMKIDKVELKNFMEKLIVAAGSYNFREKSISENLKNFRVKKLVESDPRFKRLVRVASKLEGMYTTVSSHTSGIVIADKDGWFDAPLMPMRDGRMAVCADGNEDAASMGMVKFDVLSSKNTTLIEYIENELKDKLGEKFERDNLWHLGSDSFDFLKKNPEFINQFCGKDVKKYMSIVQPKSLNDLVTAIAIRNPSITNDDRALFESNKKNGEMKLPFGITDPAVKDVLSSTNGIFILDEQILDIASKVARMSEIFCSDLLTGIRKNKPEMVAAVKSHFINGAVKNGRSDEAANLIFSYLESLVGKYSFCKAHAYSYVMISIEQSELKRKHPAEFFNAALKTYKMDTERKAKFTELRAEYERNGISVRSPSITQGSLDSCVLIDTGTVKELYLPVSQLINKLDLGEAFLHFLKESEPMLLEGDFDLIDLTMGAYTSILGLYVNPVTTDPNVLGDKVLMLQEVLGRLIASGCVDDVCFDATQPFLTAYPDDLLAERGVKISYVKELINRLAYSDSDVFIEEIVIDPVELGNVESSAFGFRISGKSPCSKEYKADESAKLSDNNGYKKQAPFQKKHPKL
ncbi:hypothetical protein [Photobacterium kishitanii]|uniref:Uncharacterized protein n=1 Tax=Photobacterium kishitanii TaxID=318456 RepID=A0A2T3KMU9_9GAMM|nr:hypothetical protein [Photobacterium kishitanii]PSV01137.1 hypothetical protein C9J27_03700 [Photobacterium kishitanii]